ncbi:MAG TPA: DUF1684 domain-containing protein [Acidimicrobiia bacterium]|nr:DUF1684 domain-containing protein [Acidimicrobiia bacterium]
MSLAVLDWRRRVAALYMQVHEMDDPAAAHTIWCLARDHLFAEHPASPLLAADRATFAGLRYAPYDPTLRFTLPIEDDERPARLDVGTGTDGVVIFERLGHVQIPGFGSLDAWWLAGYGGGLFLPVKDPNPDTYGGGRYLLDTAKGADLGGGVLPDGTATVVIDLNFTYNPSCAYDPAWACPLAPPGNTLDRPIHAGELSP